MNDVLWFIVIVAGIVIYNRYEKNKKNQKEFDDLWVNAERYAYHVRKLGEGDLYEMINAMEKDIMRLKERYNHDKEKQSQIGEDWMKYAECLNSLVSSSEMWLHADEDDRERIDREKNDLHITIKEIENDIYDELGESSEIALTHQKIKEGSESEE
ncbi:MAG: hypothetical protein KAT32_02715 [Candidatus Moranbacteria bacterium]|nr:hypothetical protein [Candidatus Moranbacteria bacterium]